MLLIIITLFEAILQAKYYYRTLQHRFVICVLVSRYYMFRTKYIQEPFLVASLLIFAKKKLSLFFFPRPAPLNMIIHLHYLKYSTVYIIV